MTIRHKWEYDTAGRLKREIFDHATNNALDFIADYEYDLAGNRTWKKTDKGNALPASFYVDEAIQYVCDANDRLVEEILNDTTATNADLYTKYTYNKTQQIDKTIQKVNSTGVKVSQTKFEYDPQGRLSKTQIDSEGNGTFETVTTYEYDADGIRVSTTENGTTTTYVIDGQNPTGYAQVFVEKQGTTVKKSYTIGHDVISQKTGATPYFFAYDGHGSTRALTATNGTIALSGTTKQIFHYDAYGNAHGFVPADALTTLLYSGEQFDAKIGMQYLRQRYYDPRTGRFNRLDTFFGNLDDPQSLHKYAYTHANPVMGVDPSGEFLVSLGISMFTMSRQMAFEAGKVSIGMTAAWGVAGAAVGGVTYGLAGRNVWTGAYNGALVGASLNIGRMTGNVNGVLWSGFIGGVSRGVTEMYLHMTKNAYPLDDLLWNILDSVAIGMWDGATSQSVKGFWGLDNKDNGKGALAAIVLAGVDGGLSSLIQDIPVLCKAKGWQDCEKSFDRAYTAAAVAASEKLLTIAVDRMEIPESVILDLMRAVLEPIATGTVSIIARRNIDFWAELGGLFGDFSNSMKRLDI